MSPNSKRTDRSGTSRHGPRGKSGKPKSRRPRPSDRNVADNGGSSAWHNDTLADPEADSRMITGTSDSYPDASSSADTTMLWNRSQQLDPNYTAGDLVSLNQAHQAHLQSPATVGSDQTMIGAPPDTQGYYGTVYRPGPSSDVQQSFPYDPHNEDDVYSINEEELYRTNDDDPYRGNDALLYREAGRLAGYPGSSGGGYTKQDHINDLLEVDGLFCSMDKRLPENEQ